MKKEDLKAKSVPELEKSLEDHKKELFNLRFQKVSGALTNTARVRVVRRTIARLFTEINLKKNKNEVVNA